ncbi:hypothetical protein ElyMa_005496300 [Elysia marginata]|uniref:Uncharacterized protein n=1 Tax=Elysia marginata TaxID=1093978 RepID=A0AAV4ESR5_9GAST|nr:hypothetical protein ElyMa_005496300 [Elysia marginata]
MANVLRLAPTAQDARNQIIGQKCAELEPVLLRAIEITTIKKTPRRAQLNPQTNGTRRGRYMTYKKWTPQQMMMSSTSTQWIQQ